MILTFFAWLYILLLTGAPGQTQPGHLVTALLFVLHFDFFPSWISSPTPDIGGMLLVCLITHLALGQLAPAPQPQVALRPVAVHGGQVWVPAQGVLCWYEALPCTFLVP